MKLRKVMFKKWIPQEYLQAESGIKQAVAGTGCWQKDFENAGLFHQWGCLYEELESGAGNFTIAIVEMSDGTIQEVLPTKLKFVDLPSY